MEKSNKEKSIRCPHCNQRLLDAEYVVGTIKCPRCKNRGIANISDKTHAKIKSG